MEERLPRKLAAILYADVAGYSRLTGEDEEGTHRRLSEYLDLISGAIEEHHGRVVHYAGDAVLADFGTVTEAITCATAIQSKLANRNQDVPDERKVRFRIGVNLGEVIVDRADIYGDGVNVAARLENLAEPGGICISESVRTAVGKKLDVGYEFMGEQRVKNIEEPLRAYRVVMKEQKEPVATATDSPALELPDKPSIAVLPFTNMSDDPEQEYFSDGITEDIITELSRFPSLFVIARHSSFAFKGQKVDVKEVGQRLGVQYVVEGSVRRATNRVRITAQLVETGSGKHVWAQRYDRDLSDIFAVQDEVTKLIVGTIAGRVDAAEAQRVAWKPPENMNAYDLLLRGLQQFNRQERETLTRARELFQKAIRLDPNYARAYAYLAFTYISDLWYGYTHIDSVRVALDKAQKAVALDADDTFAQAVHGLVLFFLGREDEGISKLERSLELNPNDAEVLHWLGFILPFVGRASEGVDYVREAIRLNPFNFEYDNALGIALYHSGQFQESAEVLRKYADTDWRFTIAYLAGAYAQLGRIKEARPLVGRSLALREQELRERGESTPERSLTLVFEEWELARYPEACERLLAGLRKTGLST